MLPAGDDLQSAQELCTQMDQRRRLPQIRDLDRMQIGDDHIHESWLKLHHRSVRLWSDLDLTRDPDQPGTALRRKRDGDHLYRYEGELRLGPGRSLKE